MTKEAIVIGLTGQTGAGKTTVANALANDGCLVIDADKIARDVVEPYSDCLNELKSEFGEDICNKDGSLNRRILAEKAFRNNESTSKLNSITHPFIVRKITHIVNSNKSKYKMIIIDAPLLIESGLNNICKVVISVVAPKDVRLRRIVKRDCLTLEEAEKRINAQSNEEFYKSNSTCVLDGLKSSDLLRNKIVEIIDKVGS